MSKWRLSKLQRWILVTTLKDGEPWEGLPCIRRRTLLQKRPEGSSKKAFNVSLTRSIRGLCDKGLLRAYSLTSPWKAWRGLKLASVEVGVPLPRMPNDFNQAGWRKGDLGLIEITDVNERATGWQFVQVVGFTEAGKQLALMLTSSNIAKLTISEQLTPQPLENSHTVRESQPLEVAPIG